MARLTLFKENFENTKS